MTWTGRFKFGGVELANNEMARGAAEGADVPHHWFTGQRFGGVEDAFNRGIPYQQTPPESLPWYDPSQPKASRDFFGVYVLGVDKLLDSTRSATVTESIGNGGIVTGVRKAVKQPTFHAILTARSREALEYGFSWVDAVLDADACGQHGDVCGVTDLEFLTDAPPEQGRTERTAYLESIQDKVRFLHGVSTISGPFIVEEMESKGVYAYEIEFTIAATRPWVYSLTKPLELPPSLPEVIQDISYNLVRYPSMELSDSASVLMATNYSTNPSAETSSTGWSVALNSGTQTSGYYTTGTTNERSADRGNSYRGRLLGEADKTAVVGRSDVSVHQRVQLQNLATAGVGTRVSAHIWAACSIAAGSAVSTIHRIRARGIWYSPTDSNLGSFEMGTSTEADDFAGAEYVAASQLPPEGATSVLIQVLFEVSWRSSPTAGQNSDIRMYVDALAVTIP
jgi:hypothetical protein